MTGRVPSEEWRSRAVAALAHMPVITPQELVWRMNGGRIEPTTVELWAADELLTSLGYELFMTRHSDGPSHFSYIRRHSWEADQWPQCPCCGGERPEPAT